MEYQVKVTVIDKKLFPELQAQYCAVPTVESALVTMSVTSSSFVEITKGTIIGTAGKGH